MAYSAITKPSLHFNTKLYTGNGGTNAITGVGFQPDWTWIKNRTSGQDHQLYDVVRGVTKMMNSNSANAQSTVANGLTAFGTDGFTLGSHNESNDNGDNYVSWNWKAGNSQGSSNTDGTINTTYTSVNSTAGFSISQYTGTGSAGTIGHGLGGTPALVILKVINQAYSWWVANHKMPTYGSDFLYLESTSAKSGAGGIMNNTAPTSSVFSVGTSGDANGSGNTYLALCFKEVKGFSKFGVYRGNGNNTGPFIYTGFKPAWVIMKRYDSSNNWKIVDNKRSPTNPLDKTINADTSGTEGTETNTDFLSNGFKIRRNGGDVNADGGYYMYMAFAAEPIVANVGQSIPATAR